MRGSDFLSRTEADQNPEDLRRERRETGKRAREERKLREDRQSEREEGRRGLPTDRCL